MENKFASKSRYYRLLGSLVDWVETCQSTSALTVSEMSNQLSSSTDMSEWDREYYQTAIEEAKLEVKGWSDIKEAILAAFN